MDTSVPSPTSLEESSGNVYEKPIKEQIAFRLQRLKQEVADMEKALRLLSEDSKAAELLDAVLKVARRL